MAGVSHMCIVELPCFSLKLSPYCRSLTLAAPAADCGCGRTSTTGGGPCKIGKPVSKSSSFPWGQCVFTTYHLNIPPTISRYIINVTRLQLLLLLLQPLPEIPNNFHFFLCRGFGFKSVDPLCPFIPQNNFG